MSSCVLGKEVIWIWNVLKLILSRLWPAWCRLCHVSRDHDGPARQHRDFIHVFWSSWCLYCTSTVTRCLLKTGNVQGQALAKVNIGDVLDSVDNLEGALDAFEEGYRYGFSSGHFFWNWKITKKLSNHHAQHKTHLVACMGNCEIQTLIS